MSSYWSIIIPESATNLIANPSFELATTGYTTGGTNTIARSSLQARFGAYSLRCTYVDSVTLCSYTITAPAAGTYTFSAYVYAPTLSGAAVQLAIANFAGSATVTATNTLTTTNTWKRLLITVSIAGGDLSGDLVVQCSTTPSAAVVHVDAVQFEAAAYATTYIDGTQAGCKWLGGYHASKSSRAALAADGGRVYNLSDDLDIVVGDQDGTGAPAVANLMSPLALQPGELFERQAIGARAFSLGISIIGDDVADYHVKRASLLAALNPATRRIGDADAPRAFQYSGAATKKTIAAVYDGGLESGLPIGYSSADLRLRLLAPNPLFYDADGESGVVLDVRDQDTWRGVAVYRNGDWDQFTQPASISAPAGNAYVSTAAVTNGILYLGGYFLNADGIANADYIVAYDLQAATYSALSTGANGEIHRIKIGPDNNVYVAGALTTAGGVTVRGVCYWNGSAFVAIGPPSTGGEVTDLCWDTDGNLYVCGTFINFDGIANADYIAKWNGSAWAALSTGANAEVYAIAYADGYVYAAGDFTTIGGVSAARVARWNIADAAFEALDTGLTGTGPIYSMVAADDGLIYAGAVPFGGSGYGVSVWNGSAWQQIGTATGGSAAVRRLAVDADGYVYAAGDFTAIDGLTTADALAIYNGSEWVHAGIDMPGSPTQVYIAADGGGADLILIVGFNTTGTGYFAGDINVSYLGTAPAYPIIVISRSGGTAARLQRIDNITTGATLFFDYVLRDGERLTIDCRPGMQSIRSSFAGNVLASLLASSDFGAFYLMPGNAGEMTNTIAAYVEQSGSPTIEAVAYWRAAFISEDD